MEKVIKKEIYVDKSAFEKALSRYTKKKEVEQKIKAEVKKLLPKYRITTKFFNDVENNFYDALAECYKDKNAMNIKPRKLATLLDLNTRMLEVLAIAYRPLMKVQSPTIDQYTTYAETKEELEKLAVCEKLLKTINAIGSNVKIYPNELERAFSRVLIFNLRTRTYEYNWRWIKSLGIY